MILHTQNYMKISRYQAHPTPKKRETPEDWMIAPRRFFDFRQFVSRVFVRFPLLKTTTYPVFLRLFQETSADADEAASGLHEIPPKISRISRREKWEIWDTAGRIERSPPLGAIRWLLLTINTA